MAFIPDEAVKRAHSVKPSAFILYTYYCMRADRAGQCFPSLKKTALETGMAYSYASEMRTHLAAEGWLEILPGGHVHLLMGFSEIPNKSSEIPKHSPSGIPKEVSVIPNNVSEIPNDKFGNPEIPLYIEPAQLTSPIEPQEPNRIVESADADPTASRAAQAREVFDFWREHLEHPNAIFKGKRERAVLSRLKDGYTLAQVKLAVKGCRLTPHNMGENDRHQRFDDLELICRDGTHLERFISTAEAKGLRAGNLLPMPPAKEPEPCGRCKDGFEMIYNFKTDTDDPMPCRYCSPMTRRANAS